MRGESLVALLSLFRRPSRVQRRIKPDVLRMFASVVALVSLVVSLFSAASPAAIASQPSLAPGDARQDLAQPAAGALAVAKTLVSPAGRTVLFTGETATFELRVENTGTTTVTYLPQYDEFGIDCLEFLPKASPPESDSSNAAGTIEWYDLTTINGLDLAPGQVFATLVNFRVSGPSSGTSQPGYNTVQVRGALDSTGATLPTVSDTFNFICATQPTVAVDKSFLTPTNRTVLLTGEAISFQVVVTNTGPTTLGYIPLYDAFDVSCLEFLPKANPPESDSSNVAGTIEWNDLTVVNGGDLPPGQAFTTTMNFLVTGPTPGPTAPGANTATVSGALDVNGLPAPNGQDTVQYTCAAPASIGDYVWHDVNGNSLQDEGPGAGLDGVTVRLYQDDGDGVFEPGGDDALIDTQVTASDGAYLFDMLHAGDYWVDVDQTTVPPTMSLTSGTDPLLVTVAYGQAYLTADFGYRGAGIAISKIDSADPVLAGGSLTYTLFVSNPGPSDALAVVVTDTLPAEVAFVSAAPSQTSGPNPLVWNLGTIPAGGSRTITVVTTVSQNAGGTIFNRAEVSSATPDPDPDDNVDIEPTLVISPAIALQKFADPTVVLSGAQVQYTYLVTNPGDVPLANVTVADDKCSPVSGPDPAGDVNANGLLDPGEVWVYLCVAAVTADTTNTALATGQPSDPNGQPWPGIAPVEADDTAFVDVVNPAIAIEKTADPTTVYPGEQVVYTYAVTNAGDVPLAGVTVSDDRCSPVVYISGDADGDGLLDLTETWLFRCTAVVSEDTLNTATTSGQPSDPSGQPLPGIGPVRDQDTATVDVIRPAIQVMKTPSATQVPPGTLVTYTYAVTNIGDAPLANVAVTDNQCAPVSGPDPAGDVNGNGLLDPGETWLYTCSATLNEDTANTTTVTAVDPLGGPVSDDDTAFVDVVRAGLQVDKTASAAVVYAGDTVTYTYTVSNNSSDPIYSVAVSDDMCSPVTYLGGDTNADGVLDPGESWTYQCVAVLGQDTVNVVTATGQDALGGPVSDGDSATVDVIHPAINVVKTATPTVVLPGGAVLYTYEVTNPGDDPLSNITVTDDKCSPVVYQSGDLDNDGQLDPGELWRFTCTANPIEDTTNTVTAVGDDSLGNPVRDTDIAFVDVVRPAINVVKTANPTVVLPGSIVLYSYVVTNPGDVPLGHVALADDTCAPAQYQAGDVNSNGLLDPGEIWVFTCATVVTVDTINTVTATGQPTDPNGQPLPGIPPVRGEDTAEVDVVDPAIKIVKTADPTTVYPGGSVTYTYVVTNPGDVPLAGVTVSDDKCSPVTYVSGDTNGNGLLEPTESWTFTCTTVITEDTLNTATTSGQPTDPTGQPLPGIGPVRDQDTALVDVIHPAIQIVKTPSATQVVPGTNVTYSYAVTNIGDTPLSNVTPTDDKCNPLAYQGGDINANGKLDPAETWTYTCTALLVEDTANTATVTAQDPLGNPVEDTDTAFVDVLTPGLQIDKSVSPTIGYQGQAVLYTYTVRHIGAAPVYNVVVTDDKCSPVIFAGGDTNGNNVLDGGEIWTFTCSSTLTSDLTNIATVTGQDALGNPVQPDQAAATVDVIHPAIQVVKSAAPTVVLPGGQVVYTYEVTNPGDDPLSNVTVTDDKCSPVVYQGGDLDNDGLLDPGEIWVYTCVAHPTEDTTNTVTATGDDSLGNPVRDTDTAFVDVVRPAINVVKTANPAVVLPGGAVLYTYQVTNAGDTPLAGVGVADDTCFPVQYQGGDTNGNGLLETGETWLFTCTATVTTDTLNTATATGQPTDPNGIPLPGIPPVSDEDTAIVDVVNPRINVEKTATPATIHSGDSVVYTYVVTNPGDVPLAGVALIDDQCAPISGPNPVGDVNLNGLLDPGETWTYTCTMALAVDTLNTVIATGLPVDPTGQPLPGIPPVSDQATALVDVLNPAIRVVKSGPTASFVGDTVTFTYEVTNAGDTPLANVTVGDDVCGAATYIGGDANGDGKLGLAETWLFECTYVVQPGDPDPLVNVATAQGQDALGLPVSAQDTWQTDLITASFGDFVWFDDGDGVQEPGETTGVNGVPVHVTGIDVLGNVIDLTVTTVNGAYLVSNLLPGTYTATVPASVGGYSLSTPPSLTFTLTTAAPQRLDIDFGYTYPTGVAIVSFDALAAPTVVHLSWEVVLADGAQAPQFHVWRAENAKGTDAVQLTTTPVAGVASQYAYDDLQVTPGGRYWYWVADTLDGMRHGPVSVTVPTEPTARKRAFLPVLRIGR